MGIGGKSEVQGGEKRGEEERLKGVCHPVEGFRGGGWQKLCLWYKCQKTLGIHQRWQGGRHRKGGTKKLAQPDGKKRGKKNLNCRVSEKCPSRS